MTRQEIKTMRAEYLALTDEQERADYLWSRRISGGVIGLSPSQYPNVPPRHEPCPFCGGAGEPVETTADMNVKNNRAIRCRECGRQTAAHWSTLGAWRSWDDGSIGGLGQLTLRFD